MSTEKCCVHREKLKVFKQILISSLVLVSFCSSVFAIPEEHFEKMYAAGVVPFYKTVGQSGSFSGVNGIHIRYRHFINPFEKAAIVIAPGYGDSFMQYAELAFDLFLKGYSLYIIDHRGQGFSGRFLENHQIGHVDQFEYYVHDLWFFVESIVKSKEHQKLYLLGHSIGGAIAALYAHRFPKDFNGVIFAAPMFEINTGDYPVPFAYTLASLQTWIGRGDVYALGQGDRERPTFDVNTYTHSWMRFLKHEEIIEKNPVIALGGVSYQWVKEALEATWKIEDIAENFEVPLLLLQAGQDTTVLPEGQNEFCKKVKNCQKIMFPDARHSILLEKDLIRDLALRDIVSFIETTK